MGMKSLGKMEKRYSYLLLVGSKVKKLNSETNVGTIGHQNVHRILGMLEVFYLQKKNNTSGMETYTSGVA